ncbi:hypothetical protein BD311DRAFT_768725, partial [Dichomitus squalens]
MVAQQSRARLSGMYSTSTPSSAFRNHFAKPTLVMPYSVRPLRLARSSYCISPSLTMNVRPRCSFEKHNSATETSALAPTVSCLDCHECQIQRQWAYVIEGSACRVCKSRTRT